MNTWKEAIQFTLCMFFFHVIPRLFWYGWKEHFFSRVSYTGYIDIILMEIDVSKELKQSLTQLSYEQYGKDAIVKITLIPNFMQYGKVLVLESKFPKHDLIFKKEI